VKIYPTTNSNFYKNSLYSGFDYLDLKPENKLSSFKGLTSSLKNKIYELDKTTPSTTAALAMDRPRATQVVARPALHGRMEATADNARRTYHHPASRADGSACVAALPKMAEKPPNRY
jgi:hypothetical protein